MPLTDIGRDDLLGPAERREPDRLVEAAHARADAAPATSTPERPESTPPHGTPRRSLGEGPLDPEGTGDAVTPQANVGVAGVSPGPAPTAGVLGGLEQ